MSEEMNHNGGLSSYEAIKIAEMSRRGKVSGVGIAGLATGAVGLFAGVAAWIYANSQAKKAQEVAVAKNEGTAALLNHMSALLAAERSERIAGDTTITQTVNDTQTGSQQGTLTAQQQSELSALQSVTNNVMNGLMTGRYSENPVQYVRVSGRRECGCDDGCGR